MALCVIGTALCACSAPTAPTSDIDGTYLLERASGAGPVSGFLILTRQGYAERRVRFRLAGGSLSKEYLARGTVTVRPDHTIDLELREMDLTATEMWKPEARLIEGGLEITHPPSEDGPGIVEIYRRK
jgi:hypothetical protein